MEVNLPRIELESPNRQSLTLAYCCLGYVGHRLSAADIAVAVVLRQKAIGQIINKKDENY